MLMARRAPDDRSPALVLNDIGPVIEARGLARIKTYVGRTPAPDDWDDAARILRRLHGAQFTALSDSDWEAFARMTYRDENGRPAGDYDPALARTLDGIEFDRPMPTLWDEFRALARASRCWPSAARTPISSRPRRSPRWQADASPPRVVRRCPAKATRPACRRDRSSSGSRPSSRASRDRAAA